VKYSVRFLTYNRLEYVKMSWESLVKSLDWSTTEVIWIDNFSTDGTRDFMESQVEKFPNIKKVINSQNFGDGGKVYDQFKEAASGEIYAKFDSDHLVRRGWLETLASYLDVFPKLGFISAVPFANDLDHPDTWTYRSNLIKEGNLVEKDGYRYAERDWSDGVAVIRKQAYLDAGSCPSIGTALFMLEKWQAKMRNKGWKVGWAIDPPVGQIHLDQSPYSLKNTKYKGYFKLVRTTLPQERWKDA